MTESTALTTVSPSQKPLYPAVLGSAKLSPSGLLVEDFGQMYALCDVLVSSGYFKDVDDTKVSVAQAITKALFGQKMGLDPLESQNELYMFKGQCNVFARLHVRRVAEHPTYAYKILESNTQFCELEIYKNAKKDSVGRILEWGEPEEENIKFSLQQAKDAGWTSKKYTPWDVDPESMLFWKCITRAYRRYWGGLYAFSVGTVEDANDIEATAEVADMSKNVMKIGKERAKDKAVAKAKEASTEDAVIVPEPVTKADVLREAAAVAEELGETERAENLEKIADFRESNTPFPDAKAGRPTAIKLMKFAAECGYSTKDLVGVIQVTFPDADIKEKDWVEQITVGQIAIVEPHLNDNRKK